jgi:RNA polymerase sigma-70 factor (ECF subfamily)
MMHEQDHKRRRRGAVSRHASKKTGPEMPEVRPSMPRSAAKAMQYTAAADPIMKEGPPSPEKKASMVEADAFRALIQQVRRGDQTAAAELVRRYEPAIRRVARIRLVDSRLRRILDSMDICQSVFASFFVRAALGQYELENPEDLFKLLVDITRKKLTDRAREELAAKRDCRRLSRRDPNQSKDSDEGPVQQAVGRELLQEFHRRLSAEERTLAEQRALGRPWAEIASERGESAEALRKRLTRAVDRVAQELRLDEMIHA